MGERKSPWNSLEVAKFIVSILTPIVVGVLGFWIQSTIAQQSQAWKASERLVDRRLTVYDEVQVKLNRIYCFIEDIGTWKQDTPGSIAAMRREVHTSMQTNRAIWSPETFAVYLDYMDRRAFKTNRGVGEDAAIRTRTFEKEAGIPGWRKEWNEHLTDETDPLHKEKYGVLQDMIARDLRLSSTKS